MSTSNSQLDQMLAMLTNEPAALKVASAPEVSPSTTPAPAAAPAPAPAVQAAAVKIANAEEAQMLATAAEFGRAFAKAASEQFAADGVFTKVAGADSAVLADVFKAGMIKGAEDTVARFRRGYADYLKSDHENATVAHLTGQAHGAFLRKHASEVVAKQEALKNGQIKQADAGVALPATLPFAQRPRDPRADASTEVAQDGDRRRSAAHSLARGGALGIVLGAGGFHAYRSGDAVARAMRGAPGAAPGHIPVVAPPAAAAVAPAAAPVPPFVPHDQPKIEMGGVPHDQPTIEMGGPSEATLHEDHLAQLSRAPAPIESLPPSGGFEDFEAGMSRAPGDLTDYGAGNAGTLAAAREALGRHAAYPQAHPFHALWNDASTSASDAAHGARTAVSGAGRVVADTPLGTAGRAISDIHESATPTVRGIADAAQTWLSHAGAGAREAASRAGQAISDAAAHANLPDWAN